MDLMLKAIAQDWAVLTPIFICSILVVYVAINRITYYKKNESNISEFVPSLQKALVKNNIGSAQRMSGRGRGIRGQFEQGNRCRPSHLRTGSDHTQSVGAPPTVGQDIDQEV